MARKLKNIELPRLNVDDFRISPKFPLILALDNIRSMNNVGSIFRTADAFRLEEIILGGITPCPPHRDIHKTALGAEFSMKWRHESNLLECLLNYREQGFQLIALEQAEESVALQDLTNVLQFPVVLILGNEIDGVAQEIVDICNLVSEIPQFGTKHSLNVTVSAGIALWQICTSHAQL